MVREFMQAIQQRVADRPTPISFQELEFRVKLHQEEAVEEMMHARDLTEVADALGDALYVIYGTACLCGIDMEPVFDEIHRSNMSKVPGGFKREDGKWMKGPGYVKPDLLPIIEYQMGKAY